MEDAPGRRRRGLHLSLALVLSLAAGARIASHLELRGGPLLYMHHWTESDMHFFHEWARGIAAGDYLSVESGKPAHSWHDNFAREVHEMTGSTEPYGPEYRRRLWDRWLGAPRFYQDPLYPYLLAAEIRTIGDHPAAVVAAQMLLGVASAGLAWFIALDLFGPGAALAAGILAALFGPSLLYEALLLRTSAITFLGLAVTAAALLALREGASRGWLVAAGALSGLSVLLKSSALLATGALLAVVLWRHRRRAREALRRAALVAAGFAATFSPLAARNVAVGVPALSVAASGTVTFVNHNAADYDPWNGDQTSKLASGILYRTNGRFLPAAIETIRTDGGLLPWLRLAGEKLLAFWHWHEVPNNASYGYYRLAVGWLSRLLVPFALVAPLAIVGLAISGLRSPGHAFLTAQILAGLALTAVFYNLSRFRAPIALLMIPFAGHALAAGARALRDRRWRALAAGTLAAAVAAAFVLRPLPAGHREIRVADYGVANEITGHLAARLEADGRDEKALALVDRVLATEPAELRELHPGKEDTSIQVQAALVAGSFAPLQGRAATLCQRLGRTEEAERHARQEQILGEVASQLHQRQPRTTPN